MTIPIRCFTNLDEHKHLVWPTTLPAVPRTGQRIASKSGRRLAIVATTWLYDGTLEVELHNWGPA